MDASLKPKSCHTLSHALGELVLEMMPSPGDELSSDKNSNDGTAMRDRVFVG